MTAFPQMKNDDDLRVSLQPGEEMLQTSLSS